MLRQLVPLVLAAALGISPTAQQPPAKPEQSPYATAKQKTGNTEEEIAEYTFWLTVFTGVLALIGGGQGFLIWRQIRLARGEFVSDQRAFVFPDDFDTSVESLIPLKLARFAFRPRWRNSGKTATSRLRVAVDWAQHKGDLPDDFAYGYRADPISLFIAPQMSEATSTVEIAPGLANQVIDAAQIGEKGWEHREPQLFIWGRADYEDIFGGKHFSEFCYRLEFGSPDARRIEVTMVQWGPHNRTDDG